MKKLNLLNKKVLYTASAFLLGFGVAVNSASPAKAEDNRKILDNIYIGDTDVSGMSEADAVIACQPYAEAVGNTSLHLVCGEENADITLAELGYDTNVENVIYEALNYGNKGNVLERFKLKQDAKNGQPIKYDLETHLAKESKDKLIDMFGHYNDAAESASVSMVDGKLVVDPGKKGMRVNIDKTVEAIEEALKSVTSATNIEIQVVCEEVTPVLNDELLGQITDCIGSFTTDYAGDAGRMANVENATNFLNGSLIMPGEEFDVNAALEPYTEENGYHYAAEYANGKVVQGLGGGICQVSTTLYNALLYAELEIVQRSNHSMTVGYVDLAMDAAISGNVKNLRFKNNMSTPIYLEGICENGKITFNIYGKETRPENRTIEFESVLVSTIAPGEAVVTVDNSLAPGTRNVTQRAKNGYVAELYKHVYIDGVLKETIKINTSNYIATPEYVTVGPGGDAPSGGNGGTTPDPSDTPSGGGGTTEPTESPTEAPTEAPTDAPTEPPIVPPTEAPTDAPTEVIM